MRLETPAETCIGIVLFLRWVIWWVPSVAYLCFCTHFTIILLRRGFCNWLTSSMPLTVRSFIVKIQHALLLSKSCLPVAKETSLLRGWLFFYLSWWLIHHFLLFCLKCNIGWESHPVYCASGFSFSFCQVLLTENLRWKYSLHPNVW